MPTELAPGSWLQLPNCPTATYLADNPNRLPTANTQHKSGLTQRKNLPGSRTPVPAV